MDFVLVDTSAWVNFFKGKETQASLYLKNNLSNIIIATCPTIVQEVLQGVALDHDFKMVKGYFDSFTKLEHDGYEIALEAANLYRGLRKTGVTIRKPNDCLIAAYAIKNDLTLLHDDKDFQFIANNTRLKIKVF